MEFTGFDELDIMNYKKKETMDELEKTIKEESFKQNTLIATLGAHDSDDEDDYEDDLYALPSDNLHKKKKI